MGLEPKYLGLEPKFLGLEPKPLGAEPKDLGLEPNLGLEPKNLGLEPKHLGRKIWVCKWVREPKRLKFRPRDEENVVMKKIIFKCAHARRVRGVNQS